MFARDALMPWRTALENVEFGMELRDIPKAERRDKALQLLDMMRLGKYVENYPAQLSQGQRQRVAIARTWATSPDVLLMDEPFSALDAQTRETLQAEFLSIWAREKKSVIFVTHDLNEAVMLADRIIVFGKGRIVHEFSVDIDRPRDILAITESPEAKKIYQTIRSLLY
jgi:NitT/TauT family transport system ATP-binding protein